MRPSPVPLDSAHAISQRPGTAEILGISHDASPECSLTLNIQEWKRDKDSGGRLSRPSVFGLELPCPEVSQLLLPTTDVAKLSQVSFPASPYPK